MKSDALYQLEKRRVISKVLTDWRRYNSIIWGRRVSDRAATSDNLFTLNEHDCINWHSRTGWAGGVPKLNWIIPTFDSHVENLLIHQQVITMSGTQHKRIPVCAETKGRIDKTGDKEKKTDVSRRWFHILDVIVFRSLTVRATPNRCNYLFFFY